MTAEVPITLGVDDPRLGPAWDAALTLAWESLRGGTTPVGAVVVDEAGAIVATGRGRRYETSGPSGELRGTHVAHAELNALAQLASDRRWRRHTLVTSLEPCLMCHGAAIQTTIERACFAAPDPYAGTGGLAATTAQARHRGLRIEGPLPDERAAFATMLHLAWLLTSARTGHVVDVHRRALPELTAFTVAIVGEVLDAAARDAIDDVWVLACRAPLHELAGPLDAR